MGQRVRRTKGHQNVHIVYAFLVLDSIHDDLFPVKSFVIACKPSLLPTRTIIYPRAHYYNALTGGIIAIDRCT